MCNESTIRQLISRFMDGQTSLEEERQLGEWFARQKQVPADLEAYRQMFAYFDQGMPLDAFAPQQPSVARLEGKPHRQSMQRRLLLSLAAACALVAVVMVLWPAGKSAAVDASVTMAVAQQPLKTDTARVMTNQDEVLPDSSSPVRPMPRPVYRKAVVLPPPAKPLMACVDEVVMADSLPSMVEDFLAQSVLQAQMEDQLLFEQVMQVGANYEKQTFGEMLAGLGIEEVY